MNKSATGVVSLLIVLSEIGVQQVLRHNDNVCKTKLYKTSSIEISYAETG